MADLGVSAILGGFAAWLAGLPRRAGRRLFAMNDLEATWRHWQVIEVADGLGRQYRDARFDLGPQARVLDDTQMSPRPPVPEAWDDHWNGCPLDGDG
jgi:hypothetical protein